MLYRSIRDKAHFTAKLKTTKTPFLCMYNKT
uniref:Uncharacterized protein n=1 Tax=Anguilla anguilla TaxID=7936 RepID=A0A0E9T3D7_ANGAN